MKILVNNQNKAYLTSQGKAIKADESVWKRPSEWGMYPSEFQAELDKEDAQRTMEAIYLLYHHNTELYGEVTNFAGFKTTVTGGFKVERGHMVGSTFTVDSTTNVNSDTFYTESFTSSMPEYILYRITPQTSGNQFSAFSFGHTDSTLNGLNQRMVECFGRTKLSLVSSIKTIYIIHSNIIAYGSINSMDGMFYGLYELENVEFNGWNTANVTNMNNMFAYCRALKTVNIKQLDVSSVTTMNRTFDNCYSITKINLSNWNTNSLQDMQFMFYSCLNLEYVCLDNINTSNLVTMNSLFEGCWSLKGVSIKNVNFQLEININSMFSSCFYLSYINLKNLNFQKPINMNRTFNYCPNLTQLDMSNFNTEYVTDLDFIFWNDSSLIDFKSPVFYISVSFDYCTKLSHDSLMSIINNLATVETAQTLTLGSTNLNKLTTEEKAIAINKGWTLA